MIGVRANVGEEDVVREFFELFKTPWEFYRRGRHYDVYLSTTGAPMEESTARTALIYSGTRIPLDNMAGIESVAERASTTLAFGASRLPIYGRTVAFRCSGIGLETTERSRHPVAYATTLEGSRAVRVGYDLFGEVRTLLTEGQPPVNAGIPALDTHIALLRELIGWSGVPLVEIPPVPEGYRFIACMTHDVDHPSVRVHRWDHTMFGFLFRACVGSMINVCRGRATIRDLLANWAAAVRLPFVHLGLASDFWSCLHRYVLIDPGRASTFFVIPRKDYAGQTPDGEAPPRRAARYGVRDISDEVRRLMAAGCEIGVHGLDAWLDSARGREEFAEVSAVTGACELGVRMHWLYGGEKSPVLLEQAGFAYDSTSGYNDTIGYRSGTTQVFKPLGATTLLELPLHVMDTALFYPDHLNLAPREARRAVSTIIDHARQFGGAVTVNWHDRSLAPERRWGRVYRDVVEDLARQDAWFPTASQAVSWFRTRRAATFETVSWRPKTVRVKVWVGRDERPPGLRLRIHKAREHRERVALGADASGQYIDVPLRQATDLDIPL